MKVGLAIREIERQHAGIEGAAVGETASHPHTPVQDRVLSAAVRQISRIPDFVHV
jgi:hypothetical protein